MSRPDLRVRRRPAEGLILVPATVGRRLRVRAVTSVRGLALHQSVRRTQEPATPPSRRNKVPRKTTRYSPLLARREFRRSGTGARCRIRRGLFPRGNRPRFGGAAGLTDVARALLAA